jgi:hypothetical protein
MTLDLSTIQNQITEIQNMISSFDVSEREKLELQELREEAAQEGGAGNFMAPTPDGFKTGDRYFQKLGVHIRGWKKYWHRWNNNKKQTFEDPSAQEIANMNLKRGADLTIQVLEPVEAAGTYTLSLAQTSYFSWRSYAETLGNMGLEPHKVLTALGYRMKQYDEGNPVALVTFTYVSFASPEATNDEATGIPAGWR